MRITMKHRVIGETIVEVHNHEPPTDEEWNRMLDTMRAATVIPNSLVVSEGGTPGAVQRKRLTDVIRGQDRATAVLTRSLVTRGAVTALGWIGHHIGAFAPSDLEGAMAFVNLSPSFTREVLVAIATMKCELASVPYPFAAADEDEAALRTMLGRSVAELRA